MRILQVAPYFHPYVGGQERYVRDLSKALAARGHNVEILASNFPRTRKNEMIDGIKISRFSSLCRPLNNSICPSMPFHLARRCRSFDVIHTHNEHAFASQCCSLAKSLSSMPMAITCHGRVRFDHVTKDFFERAYNRSLGSRILRKADMVIALSNADKRYLQWLGTPVERIRVIPSAVDLSQENPNPGSGHPESMQASMLKEKQVVLFIGPVLKRKGPHILIKAIPLILSQHPTAFFVFVGEGSFKDEAKKLSRALGVEKHTHFTGYVPKSQLNYLYRTSDVFVLPSFAEGFPYTVLDALTFSRPVICTSLPCFQEYLSDSALFAPPGDHRALADALLRLLSDRKLANQLGAKGRRLVETQLRWEIMVDKVLDVYDEIVGH